MIEQSGEPWLPLSKFILLENPNAQPKTVEQNYNVVDDRDKYRAAYHDHWNNTASHKPGPDSLPVDWTGMVDVILCPVGPSVAPKLDTSTYWGYTSQWNLLDYPALVFPVSKVDLEKDVWPEGSADDVQFLSEKDRENRALWKDGPAGPKDFEGAPIGLQLVGRRYDDEKVTLLQSQSSLSLLSFLVSLPLCTKIRYLDVRQTASAQAYFPTPWTLRASAQFLCSFWAGTPTRISRG